MNAVHTYLLTFHS